MAVYRWANGSMVSADAQAVGERLESLAETLGERIKPRDVVEDARPAESPLHPCFEWDNASAAALYREEQARLVMRSIRVVVEDDGSEAERVVHAYVSVIEPGDTSERVYVPMTRVREEPSLYQQCIEDAIKYLRAAERRFAEFQELHDIFADAQMKASSLLAGLGAPSASL